MADRGQGAAAPAPALTVTQWLLAAIAVMLAAGALHAARVLFIPLGLGLVLAMLLWPLHRWMTRAVPPWLSVLAIVLATLGLLALAVFGLWEAWSFVSGQLRGSFGAVTDLVQRAQDWLEGKGQEGGLGPHLTPGRGADGGASEATAGSAGWPPGDAGGAGSAGGTGSAAGEDTAGRIRAALLSFVTSGLGALSWVVGLVALGYVVAMFVLLEERQWRERASRVMGKRRERQLEEVVHDSAHQARVYLLAQTVSGLSAGLMTFLLCWVLGVRFAVVWGVLAFALNYLPNIGIIISGIPPVVLAFVEKGTGTGVMMGAGIAAIEAVTANVVYPLIQGGVSPYSPLLVIAALLFWGFLWGAIGAVLAVPLTALLIDGLRAVRTLRPAGELLVDEDG